MAKIHELIDSYTCYNVNIMLILNMFTTLTYYLCYYVMLYNVILGRKKQKYNKNENQEMKNENNEKNKKNKRNENNKK